MFWEIIQVMYKTSYFILEALNIVVSNPGSLFEGIWHHLWGIPSLSCSLLQESADLMEGVICYTV